MKRFVKALVVGMIITILASTVTFSGECKEISDKVFRIHILANSDSKEDQALKLKVRDEVIAYSEELLKDVHSKQEAMNTVLINLDEIQSVAQQVILDEGFDYPVKLKITKMYFDTRYYESITMPSGLYDALRIEIGKAKGKNWWCVMYPSLCIYSDAKSDSLRDNLTDREYKIITSDSKYEFRFKIVECFSKMCELFSR
ncbi:MAG: stage II sporulation protein R [Eubacteriales bacterium]|nr:stage II sporulation protein R [Eubacteriales bacterium]